MIIAKEKNKYERLKSSIIKSFYYKIYETILVIIKFVKRIIS